MTSCKRTREAEFSDEWSLKTPDAYLKHTQFCWNARQTKKVHTMPWDLKMSKCMRPQLNSVAMPSWSSRLPPLPCFPGELVDSLESDFVEDSFARVGLRAVKASDQRLWEERLSWERKCACKKWCSLILMKMSAWTIGRSVACGDSMRLAGGGLMESVVDSLAGKATSTLHARAGPLLKFAKFWKDKGMDFFPVQEWMVYDYIKAQTLHGPQLLRDHFSCRCHLHFIFLGWLVEIWLQNLAELRASQTPFMLTGERLCSGLHWRLHRLWHLKRRSMIQQGPAMIGLQQVSFFCWCMDVWDTAMVCSW